MTPKEDEIDLSNIEYFENIMKSIGRKIIIYNKSISVFERYSGNKNLLNHFLEYNGLDILDVSQFRIRKNYFITHYLI